MKKKILQFGPFGRCWRLRSTGRDRTTDTATNRLNRTLRLIGWIGLRVNSVKTGLKLNPWVQKLNQYNVLFQTDMWMLQNMGIDTGLLRLAMTARLSKCQKKITQACFRPTTLPAKKYTYLDWNTSFLFIFPNPKYPLTLCHPILLKLTDICHQLPQFLPNYA